MSNNNIVIITDIIDMRTRKKEELAFYQEQLDQLIVKMQWVQREIDVTNHIINIIENENSTHV